MSKTPRSSSRTHSRSASRSRSRSDSRSCSRSRSSSQSRSRKHRYGSRSRSRSRSHSPFHNRGRKHPREYQNHREFRGYHRGFRRPYYFRGRGRGFFRGRFQRGGGGYNNYRSNNWQNFGPYPQQKQQKQQKQQQAQQQQQQKHYAHSPKRGRSRTPKKRSNSPGSLSHSHRSDRSSSQHSHHSSSSSSSRKITASVKQNSKAGIEILSAPKDSQKAGGGDAADATLSVQEGHHPAQDGRTSGEKVPKTWLFPINHDNSPKTASPQIRSTVSAVQDNPVTSESVPVPGNSGATGNGATNSQTVASTASNSSPQKKSPTTVFSGFGLFSNADQEEDTVAISIAFKKFLEEQKNKKQSPADKSVETVADNGNSFPEIRNSKCEDAFDRSSGPRLSRSAEQNNIKESEKFKYVENSKGNTSSNTFRPAILLDDGEEEEGEDAEPHLKMRVVENEVPTRKNKVTMSARELFEEHFRRLDNRACDDELEAFLINREKERAASILSALSKREKFARKFEDLSPDRPSKVKRKEKMTSSPSPTYKALSRSSSETQEQEMFMNLGDESSPRASVKREREFSLRMDSLSEDLARSSVLSNDWKDTMDLVHCNKKGFQQRWCNNLCRSPKELFAQHVISIVHYVTAQHFSSSGMTLSDRFTMYQRLAAEKEIMKPRKSPEIHRRIDVSPSAFMRHSFLFDELKGSGDSSSKAEVKQFKGDKVDLPMNVEQRKKYLSRETNENQEERGELGNSPESSMESSMEKTSKHHKKSKKSKKKRERSHSSSSSSSFVHEEETESTEKSSAQLKVRECVGSAETRQAHRGFFRIRGRGWNRVNCLGNDSKCTNNAHVPGHSNNMNWDSEQRATSKKYYLPDEKYVEGERKWVNTQGRGQSAIPRVRGRFILRRPTISITTNNSNWSHDKFKASGDDGEPGKRDHKEQNNA
ncbi:thyroid hormone receptor-associated protein 3 isoform X2 [Hemibagrus wyckioides]|uniref:thyroid hormone receptor-associated protein 3 isoform X2 n=1 Tax=Hemibagrus wyckioides TaxID=337641 RepID=UPI00266D71BE|nr:thyroid hormone receptor-associated protein 3 isoform X2 [Hemibagrus wyckioides]